MNAENYADFERRLSEHAMNLSLNVEGKEVRRYLIPFNERAVFPELNGLSAEKVTLMISNMGISQIILPYGNIIRMVGNFENGFAIKGMSNNKFWEIFPEDAIRIERKFRPNALMEIYQ